jgi:hypothetical protein
MILAACGICRTVKLDPEPAKITDANRAEFLKLGISYNPHRIVVYCGECRGWREFIMFDPTVSHQSSEPRSANA